MAAPKGNQFWKLADFSNKEKKFNTPEIMGEKIAEYIEACLNNPIEVESATSRGVVTVRKAKPMTIKGICAYLGIVHSTWLDYKNREEFTKLITRVEELVYDQKYTYAAIGEFNSNIIARDLGLVDKQETDVNLSKPIEIVKQYDSSTDDNSDS